MLVDERGVPLSLTVTGANRHDVTQLEPVLKSIVVDRPHPSSEALQHMCADKCCYGEPAQLIIVEQEYIPHVNREALKSKNLQLLPDTEHDVGWLRLAIHG